MEKLDVNNMHEWPLAARSLVIALISAVVFYFGYKWDLTKLQKKLHVSQSEEQSLKDQYASAIKSEIEAKHTLAHFQDMKTLLNEWQKKLVNYGDLPELLNQILKIGSNNGLYFSLFDPGDTVDDNNYKKIPIKVIAAANYHQIADFISQTANLPWIVVVDNFVITSENADDVLGKKLYDIANSQNLLTLDLILDIYYKPDQTKEKPDESKAATSPTPTGNEKT